MDKIIAKLLIIISTISSLFSPKLGGLPIEVPRYYEDRNETHYYIEHIDKIKQEITASEYKNVILQKGEKAYSSNAIKERILKDNEYYRISETDESSTTQKIIIKLPGKEVEKKLISEIGL